MKHFNEFAHTADTSTEKTGAIPPTSTSPVDKQETNTIDHAHPLGDRCFRKKPKYNPRVRRWAHFPGGRPPEFSPARTRELRAKELWEKIKEKLARYAHAETRCSLCKRTCDECTCDAPRFVRGVLDLYRAGELERRVTWAELAPALPEEVRAQCKDRHRRAIVRMAQAMRATKAEGLIMSHDELGELLMFSGRHVRRVLGELLDLEVLPAPDPNYDQDHAVHNRRANGYTLCAALCARLAAIAEAELAAAKCALAENDRASRTTKGQASPTASEQEHEHSGSAPRPPFKGGRALASDTRALMPGHAEEVGPGVGVVEAASPRPEIFSLPDESHLPSLPEARQAESCSASGRAERKAGSAKSPATAAELAEVESWLRNALDIDEPKPCRVCGVITSRDDAAQLFWDPRYPTTKCNACDEREVATKVAHARAVVEAARAAKGGAS